MCGTSSGQEGALASDQAFQKTLTSNYAKEFGQNQTLMNNLTTNLGGIISAGPGQQGFTAPELAAKNSQAINSAAASNQKLQTVIGENGAKSGGAPGVESGVQQAERASAATAVDTGLNNTEANITNENYDVGRQNYFNAVGAQEKAPGAFEDPTNQMAGEVTGANNATAGQANQNAADSTGTEMLGLGEGLASDTATFFGCVTPETMVTMHDGELVPAGDLKVGDAVYGVDGPEKIENLILSVQPVVRVTFSDFETIDVSESHTFATPVGGYIQAHLTRGETLRSVNGSKKVRSAMPVGLKPVIKICLTKQHAYISNGVWSLE